MLLIGVTDTYFRVCFPTGTAPSVVIEPKHRTVREGKGLSLSCVATGEPKPRIKWKKNGKNIPQVPGNRIRIRFTDTRSKLRIKNATIQDSGMYHCVAKNPLGYSNSGKATVHVIGGAGFYTILSNSVSCACYKIRHTILQILASLACR